MCSRHPSSKIIFPCISEFENDPPMIFVMFGGMIRSRMTSSCSDKYKNIPGRFRIAPVFGSLVERTWRLRRVYEPVVSPLVRLSGSSVLRIFMKYIVHCGAHVNDLFINRFPRFSKIKFSFYKYTTKGTGSNLCHACWDVQ